MADKLTLPGFPDVEMVQVDMTNLKDAYQLFYKLFSYDKPDHLAWSVNRKAGLAGPYQDKDFPNRDQISDQTNWLLKKDGKYVGMLALKQFVGQENEAAWIDWYATLSTCPPGYGKAMLEFMHDRARNIAEEVERKGGKLKEVVVEGSEPPRTIKEFRACGWSTTEEEYRTTALLTMGMGYRREIHPEDHQKAAGTPYEYVNLSINAMGNDIKERHSVTMQKDIPTSPTPKPGHRLPFLPPGAADWDPNMEEDAFPTGPGKKDFPTGFIPRSLRVNDESGEIVGYANTRHPHPAKKGETWMLAEDYFRANVPGLKDDANVFIPRYVARNEEGKFMGYWHPKSEDAKPPLAVKGADGKKYFLRYTEVHMDEMVPGLARTRNIHEYRNNEPKMEIKPVSWENLNDAQRVMRRIFPEDSNDALAFSLLHAEGKLPKVIYEATGISDMRYWIATWDGKPAGLVGLYQYAGHEGEVWGGWHGVDEHFRGKHIGRHLLHYTNEVARKEGNHTRRGWSIDDEESAVAVESYFPKLGYFTEVDPTAKYPGHMVTVHSLNLENPGERPRKMWAEVPNHPNITGYAYEKEFEDLVVSSGLAETMRASLEEHKPAAKAHVRGQRVK